MQNPLRGRASVQDLPVCRTGLITQSFTAKRYEIRNTGEKKARFFVRNHFGYQLDG